jgi:hypothetical protein
MRNGHQGNKHQHQHHRMRGRNRGGGKSHNPLTRVYESNGPDVKIRGTANHIAEKYIQLARDATASGDPVAAENYYQHAEHYFRLIAAAQEQLRQNQPYQQQPRPEGGDIRQEENFDDGDENAQPAFGGEPHSPREQQQNYAQPYQREQQQPYPPREQQQRHERQDNRSQNAEAAEGGDIGLPSFITGNQQPNGGNGHDNQGDRFPLHRRRRRGHRGPRPDAAAGAQSEGSDDATPSGE